MQHVAHECFASCFTTANDLAIWLSIPHVQGYWTGGPTHHDSLQRCGHITHWSLDLSATGKVAQNFACCRSDRQGAQRRSGKSGAIIWSGTRTFSTLWRRRGTAVLVNCNFSILQDSAATVLRWGGQNYFPLRQVSSWCCTPWNIIRIGQLFTVLLRK